MGMAHRGRLNVLANILDKPYQMIFPEFEDNFAPEPVGGDGDVKYHRGYSSDHVDPGRHDPAHQPDRQPQPPRGGRPGGRGPRARQAAAARRHRAPHQGAAAADPRRRGLRRPGPGGRDVQPVAARGLPHRRHRALRGQQPDRLHHAAGRGALDALRHRRGQDGRGADLPRQRRRPRGGGATSSSSPFASASEFERDVVVDMVCYRRHGHNEGDEPAFTQPVLYGKIEDHPSVRELYSETGSSRSTSSAGRRATRLSNDFTDRLQRGVQGRPGELSAARCRTTATPSAVCGTDSTTRTHHEPVDTGVAHQVADAGGPRPHHGSRGLQPQPQGGAPAPRRSSRRSPTAGEVDWGLAELAGLRQPLLAEELPVRLSGQDSIRGTFSQRHAVWYDTKTQETYIPLNHIRAGAGPLLRLQQHAVRGRGARLRLRLLAGRSRHAGDLGGAVRRLRQRRPGDHRPVHRRCPRKWQRASGLVMLLPHGYEGQGPEHSNAYLERYLTLCAEDNIQVCNLTTPAQYFHVLRRQLERPFRRPLVVMSPKSLLRHRRAVSPVDELVTGRFQEILDDPIAARPSAAAPGAVQRARSSTTCCEGRERGRHRRCRDRPGRAALPVQRGRCFAGSSNPTPGPSRWSGSRRRPENRGGWTLHAAASCSSMFPNDEIATSGREPSASPATGSLRVHRKQQAAVVAEALEARGRALPPQRMPGSMMRDQRPCGARHDRERRAIAALARP